MLSQQPDNVNKEHSIFFNFPTIILIVLSLKLFTFFFSECSYLSDNDKIICLEAENVLF